MAKIMAQPEEDVDLDRDYLMEGVRMTDSDDSDSEEVDETDDILN